MKRRVRFLKIPKGTRVQGVFGAMTEYIREGDAVDGNNGGGFIGQMELVGNTLHIKKVDGEGNPHRNFGAVAGRSASSIAGADSRKIPLIVDAVSVSAAGFTVLYDEEPDAPKPANDEQPARPIPKQGQGR